MTIYDYWLNPLDVTVPAITVLGYREDLEEFPHELYSFFLSSIRDADIKDVRLLWRWLRGMQQEWESIYGKILNLPLLYSPSYCPEAYLDYLAMNVGITSPDLDYLWGELTTNDKRKLISIFVQSLIRRGTDDGITRLIQTMTGQYAEVSEYFDFRWIISGDTEYNMESALGYENDIVVAGDTWLLSEDTMPVGVVPDEITILPVDNDIVYVFKVTTLINNIVDPPIPPNPPLVRMIYRPIGVSVIGVIIPVGSDWFVCAPRSYTFEQTVEPYSDRLSDFRISLENDAYIFDIRVMDDVSVNRDMVTALAKFSRPISERIYIRYFLLIDHFTDIDLDNWTDEGGGVSLDVDIDEVTLSDPVDESIMRSDVSNDDTWTNYSFGIRVRAEVAERTLYMRFFWQDANNYMELGFYPATEPHVPVGQWELTKVVAGVPVIVTVGNLEQFDLDVNYFFRIVAFLSNGDLILRGYQDENLLFDGPISPSPWALPQGKVEIACQAGGSYVVCDVEVHSYPMEENYIGP